MGYKNRVIAFYLPQYHPIPENDKWWGQGFTEWTNVGKAKPMFIGHYQPKVPADLGYYDLRLPEVREAQAKMAKEHGVEGFCYWHYWFGNGKRLLERPFDEVLASGKPDFPFCLAWANHSWEDKTFNNGGTNKMLLEQTYPGIDDHIKHFMQLLPAFKDHRYITVDGKPLFVIYDPFHFPDITSFIALWSKLAKENGLKGIHFVAHCEQYKIPIETIHSWGFDAINLNLMWGYWRRAKKIDIKAAFWKLQRILFPMPRIVSYKKISKTFVNQNEYAREWVYPTIIPNWDTTARRKRVATVLTNATPKLFQKHCQEVVNAMQHKSEQHRIAFIKSWNEWGEGNYMEPCLKYGKGYLEALKKVLESNEG